jgi:HsdM N-terminal domain
MSAATVHLMTRDSFDDAGSRIYPSDLVFPSWVPQVARWETLRDQAKQSKIGKLLDEALIAIEDHNPSLKNILDKRFARTQIEPSRLGQLIDLISKIGFNVRGQGEGRAGRGIRILSWAVRHGGGEEGRAVLYAGNRWCGCWWRCCPLTRGASTIHAAGQAVCLCSRRSLLRRTAARR